MKADRKRTEKEKLIGFGYNIPLGKGINRKKSFPGKNLSA